MNKDLNSPRRLRAHQITLYSNSWIALACVLTLCSLKMSHADQSAEKHIDIQTGASSKLDQAMKDNSRKMDSLPMTGNIDEDFARMMIPHHQAAIDAAKIQLQEGNDPEIKRIAEKSIRSQEKDILKLNAWLKKKRNPTTAR